VYVVVASSDIKYTWRRRSFW